MGLDPPRASIAVLPLRPGIADIPLKSAPADRALRAYPERFRRLTARHPASHRGDHTATRSIESAFAIHAGLRSSMNLESDPRSLGNPSRFNQIGKRSSFEVSY